MEYNEKHKTHIAMTAKRSRSYKFDTIHYRQEKCLQNEKGRLRASVGNVIA